MVGHWVLVPAILVQIQVSEPAYFSEVTLAKKAESSVVDPCMGLPPLLNNHE